MLTELKFNRCLEVFFLILRKKLLGLIHGGVKFFSGNSDVEKK